MERRWLCLHLPKFPCQRIVRIQPSLRDKPFVMTSRSGSSLKVVVASSPAMAQGVKADMSLSAAQSLVSSLLVIEEDRAADRRALLDICHWSQWLSPWVAPYTNDSLSLATNRFSSVALMLQVSGVSHPFGDEGKMLEAVSPALTRFGYTARLAIADTPRAAHALAQFAPLESCIAASGASAAACEELPVWTLGIESSTVDELASLGLQTIGQLLKLPRRSLGSRFGDVLPLRLAELSGDVTEELPPWRGEEHMIERIECDPPVGGGEGLHFIVKRLADLMAERLRGAGLGVRGMLLRLRGEDAHSTELSIGTSMVRNDPRWLSMLLSTKLEGIELDARIEAAELLITASEPMLARHASIFDARREGPRDSLPALLDRLISRLGPQGVQRAELIADYRPERAWRALPFAESVTQSFHPRQAPLRPFRVLSEARPIRVEAKEGEPRAVDSCAVLHAEGPERIVTAWWDEHSARRDYYRVMLVDGQWLWIFHDLASGDYYLHGVFA